MGSLMYEELEKYFLTLKNESSVQYDIAKKAREQGSLLFFLK